MTPFRYIKTIWEFACDLWQYGDDMLEEIDVDSYCLGLLVEEGGEAFTHIGRAFRFGIDTPENSTDKNKYYHKSTSRNLLTKELADVKAAIEFTCLHRVVNRYTFDQYYKTKLQKLLDRNKKDNLGRPLAPYPKDLESLKNAGKTS